MYCTVQSVRMLNNKKSIGKNRGFKDSYWTINNVYKTQLRIWFMWFEKKKQQSHPLICESVFVSLFLFLLTCVFHSHFTIGMHFEIFPQLFIGTPTHFQCQKGNHSHAIAWIMDLIYSTIEWIHFDLNWMVLIRSRHCNVICRWSASIS